MADKAVSRMRWDTDDRYSGVADAKGFAAAIDDLAALRPASGLGRNVRAVSAPAKMASRIGEPASQG